MWSNEYSMSTSTTNKDQHETFVKKISQWEKMSRSNWKWEQAPSHRQKLLQVFKTNKKLSTEMMDDMKSLNGLEQGLEVMNYYIKESDKNMIRKNQDHETDDTKKDEDIRLDINQCLILKKDTQEKIKRNLQTQKESTSIKNSLSSQYASPPKASKPPILEEVPKSTRYETGITFLTDVEVVDLPIEKPKTPVQKRPNISVEKESQVPQRTRNIQTVESLLKLLPPKEETNIRRKSAGSMIVKPLSRPSTAYHDVDGPSMIDRQMEWMEKVEAKRRSAKIAKDQELVKEVR